MRDALWRCENCYSHKLLCQSCCRDRHTANPYHRVRRWNGSYFEMGALWQVGVKLNLGHDGNPCDSPHFTNDTEMDLKTERFEEFVSDGSDLDEDEGEDEEDTGEFQLDDVQIPKPPRYDSQGQPFVTVVDVSGVHYLPVVRCHCGDASTNPDPDEPFVRLGLFPTSFKEVKTVFTRAALEDFRISNLECKVSAYHYYQKLRRITCPANPKSVLDRYRELRRLSRVYRNLMLRMEFGWGYYDGSPPPEGQLAYFCPTCPQPGVNLPDDWKEDENR